MYSNTVLALFDAKQAALYFRYVIPCGLVIELVREKSAKRPLPTGAGENLFPPHLVENEKFFDRLIAVNRGTLNLFGKSQIEKGRVRGPISGVTAEEYPLIEQRWVDTMNEFIKEFGFANHPIDVPDDMSEEVSAGDVAISLTQIPLVNTRSASWDQILEFRKDPKAVQKLRRLRLFMSENYEGKSRAYVEDDICRRLDDYSEAARQAGFETISGAFGSLVDSKLLAGGLAGSLISTLAGAPVAAAISASGTVMLEVGKLVLQIRKTRYEQRKLLENNPVSYVSYVNERLKNEATREGDNRER